MGQEVPGKGRASGLWGKMLSRSQGSLEILKLGRAQTAGHWGEGTPCGGQRWPRGWLTRRQGQGAR